MTWQLLAALSTAGWLGTLLYLWRSRRRTPAERTESPAATGEKRAWKRLLAACNGNDPAVARNAALDWAAARIEPRGGNLLPGLDCPPGGERFEDLLQCGRVRIERILSSAAPEPRVYDQPQDEWVLLLEGRARLELDGRPLDLGPGDWLFIPARTPHRVLATWPEPRCLWLAVHMHPDPGEGADGQAP